MKKFAFFFIIAATLTSCDIRKKDRVADDASHKMDIALKDSTTVQLIDSIYNFGTIKEGVSVNYSFRFKNTGKKALVITEAHASCGCTVPEKPEKPILPGEIGFLKVVFNSKNKSGHIEKAVIVSSNVIPQFPDLRLVGEVTK